MEGCWGAGPGPRAELGLDLGDHAGRLPGGVEHLHDESHAWAGELQGGDVDLDAAVGHVGEHPAARPEIHAALAPGPDVREHGDELPRWFGQP